MAVNVLITFLNTFKIYPTISFIVCTLFIFSLLDKCNLYFSPV